MKNNLKIRWVERKILDALKVMPAVVVTGARQTGKTTLVRDMAPGNGRRYFSLDDLDNLRLATEDPQALLGPGPVTIDEIQREPRLLLSLKAVIDEHRKPGMALLTGSANLALLHSASETLAGRAFYINLPPFCPLEWAESSPHESAIDTLFSESFDRDTWPVEKCDWRRALLSGGYPGVLDGLDMAQRDIWFAGYVSAYLERDLRNLSAVSNLPDFQRLMRLVAFRTARVANQSDLARDAALKQSTCHRYLNLLETGCQIARVPAYAANPSISIVKAPKLLWSDCGLAAWLAGIHTLRDCEKRHDSGFWFEQTVYQTLQSWISLDPARRRLYYWRDRKGNEVDFILENGDMIVAIEVKSSSRPAMSDCNGLREFQSYLGKKSGLLCRSVVLHTGTAARDMGHNCLALPAGCFFP